MTSATPSTTVSDAKAAPKFAIGFDWDDTLFDGNSAYKREYGVGVNGLALQKILDTLEADISKEQGKEFRFDNAGWPSVEEYRGYEFFAMTIRPQLKALGYDDARAEATVLRACEMLKDKRQEMMCDTEMSRMLPGAVDLLRNLVDKGVPVFISSNTDQRVVEAIAKAHLPPEILAKIPIIGTTHALPASDPACVPMKPNPMIIHHATEKLGINPKETTVLYVGDNPTNDIRAAVNAGCKAILVSDRYKDTYHETMQEVGMRQRGKVVSYLDKAKAGIDGMQYLVCNYTPKEGEDHTRIKDLHVPHAKSLGALNQFLENVLAGKSNWANQSAGKANERV